MAESYLDKSMSKPINIVMNLLLPFVICGLISLFIKILIMPNYFIDSVEEKIKKNPKIREYIENINKMKEKKQEIKQEEVKKEEEPPPEPKARPGHRSLKNKNQKGKNEVKIEIKNDLTKELEINNKEFEEEKKIIEKETKDLYKSYLKRILIYFIVGFLIIAFNWYMMTSFCSIYRNTGVKLIINSFISLFASFVIPFILGIIPTLVGYLAVKTKNKVIRKIYETINFII